MKEVPEMNADDLSADELRAMVLMAGDALAAMRDMGCPEDLIAELENLAASDLERAGRMDAAGRLAFEPFPS